ncbi:hypothetical protein HK096_005177 [Nowakowskiella sp. JEL0078]|nr:hypothetical protein HK096_005177 [Nowakowskiella sp. JEL0078]
MKDGAAISEDRSLTNKYNEDKLIGTFIRAAQKQITKTEYFTAGEILPESKTAAPVVVYGFRNLDTGAEFRLVRHEKPSQLGLNSVKEVSKVWLPISSTFSKVPTLKELLAIEARNAKLLVANYPAETQHIAYITADILTHFSVSNTDFIVVYAEEGDTSEIALGNHLGAPTVKTLLNVGKVSSNLNDNVLIVSFEHIDFTPIHIIPKQANINPCIILAVTRKEAYKFWKFETKSGHNLLIRGPYLVRSAEFDELDGVVKIRGDLDSRTSVEVFGPSKNFKIEFNGKLLKNTYTTEWGSIATSLNGPPISVKLPSLVSLKPIPIAPPPESSIEFDDSKWIVCDKQKSNLKTPNLVLPILFSDDYGFHNGHISYRGHFTATGHESGITIEADGGDFYIMGVWLNGKHIGYVRERSNLASKPVTIAFPEIEANTKCVVYILMDNMGRNDDWHAQEQLYKEFRGLNCAVLEDGDDNEIVWKVQGSLGGEAPIDTVRGAYNTGGLMGERLGLHLPGFPLSDVGTLSKQTGYQWFGTDVELNISEKLDAAISLCVNAPDSDKPFVERKEFRLQFYVNGWLFGRYVNNLGPQSKFPIPPGIINSNGVNRLVVAVWDIDADINWIRVGEIVNLATTKIVVYGGDKIESVAAPNYGDLKEDLKMSWEFI